MQTPRITVLLILALASFVALPSCARKKMSDRETKREQMRNSAEAKRKELSQAAGLFRGFLVQDEFKQDISLNLELKDIPDTSAGEVDPVLVPILTGSLRITFGPLDEGEFYSFAIQKADYDAKRKRIDVVASNEEFNEIVLSLDQPNPDSMTGTWTAPSVSASGEVDIKKANDLNLKGEDPDLKGDYIGHLIWEKQELFQHAQITLSTSQDKADGFSISGNVKMISGDQGSSEALVYALDQVEFNPLTRQISLKGSQSDVFFRGHLADGAIVGDWHSKLFGKTGGAVFSKTNSVRDPADLARLMPIKGAYYGEFTDTNPNTNLPSKVMLNLVPYHDVEKPGGLGVSGNIRFYFGPFSSTEYIEFPFNHTEYNFFTRNLDAKTDGSASLTIDADINQGSISGLVSDDAFGLLGSLRLSQDLPDEDSFSIGGEYVGYFLWNDPNAFQTVTLNVVPTFGSGGAINLSATAKLIFGDPASSEQLVYKFDQAEFSPTTGFAVFKSQDSEITIKGHLVDGVFRGKWFTSIRGEMGEIALSKDGTDSPANRDEMSSLKGTYRGSVVNTSNQSNLPERILFGLVTAPDLNSPRGIKVTGNVRFYWGPFDSQEYSEYPLEDLQFDFFTRKIVGKTNGDLHLTLKGEVGASDIQGQIFHDGLGELANFNVTK